MPTIKWAALAIAAAGGRGAEGHDVMPVGNRQCINLIKSGASCGKFEICVNSTYLENTRKHLIGI